MATYSGDRWGKQRYAWERYQPGGDNAGDMVPVWNVSAQTLNHEIGHNMGLLHTELNYCNSNGSFDYCDDTPTWQEYLNVLSNYGFADTNNMCKCGYHEWSAYCNNNLMEYDGFNAVTPQQLGRQHWTIENEMSAYKATSYKIVLKNITSSVNSYTNNTAYTAQNVSIPSGYNIAVANKAGIFINAERFNTKWCFF